MIIRKGRKSDARAIAAVYVQTWQDVYRGILPDEYLDAMDAADIQASFSRQLATRGSEIIVAEEGKSGIVGFIQGGPRGGGRIYGGEIHALYVSRHFQRRGVGLNLMGAMAGVFEDAGVYSMMVWALEKNPARRFYEKINGVFLRSGRIPFAGGKVNAVAYGWISTDLLPAPFIPLVR